MFAGALLSFLVLAHIDEYENLIKPLLMPEEVSITKVDLSAFNREEIRTFLLDFNKALSDVYLFSNPALAWELPATQPFQRMVHDEVAFNIRNDIVIETKLMEMSLLSLQPATLSDLSVKTRERVKIKYVSSKEGGKSASSELVNTVTYILKVKEGKFLVDAFDAVKLESHKGPIK